MPITQPPKKSISREFYSPNTQAYEVGWRGGGGTSLVPAGGTTASAVASGNGSVLISYTGIIYG